MAEPDPNRRMFRVVRVISGFCVAGMFLLSVVKFHVTYGYSWQAATLVSIPSGLVYFGFVYFFFRWVRRKL
ncbi:hypothetical protein [Microbispora sp. NPDC046933]|uniref:hypothetical protein n=1 Tax=Microbispora sp. NPDC046933 TaxID=3155618 RepID=UPI00340F045B